MDTRRREREAKAANDRSLALMPRTDVQGSPNISGSINFAFLYVETNEYHITT